MTTAMILNVVFSASIVTAIVGLLGTSIALEHRGSAHAPSTRRVGLMPWGSGVNRGTRDRVA